MQGRFYKKDPNLSSSKAASKAVTANIPKKIAQISAINLTIGPLEEIDCSERTTTKFFP